MSEEQDKRIIDWATRPQTRSEKVSSTFIFLLLLAGLAFAGWLWWDVLAVQIAAGVLLALALRFVLTQIFGALFNILFLDD